MSFPATSHGAPSASGALQSSVDVPVLSSLACSDEITRVEFHPTMDLLLIGGQTSVHLAELHVSAQWNMQLKATWRVAKPVTAISWRLRSGSDEVFVAAGQGLLRIPSSEPDSSVDTVAQTPSTIHDLVYHAGQDVLAAATDSGVLLYYLDNDEEGNGPQPVFIAQPFPIRSISFHPKLSSLILCTDDRGTGRLHDFDKPDHPLLLTLNEPRTLSAQANASTFSQLHWNPSEPDVCGGIISGRWVAYDLRTINGGRPLVYGDAYWPDLRSREVFRWCPTNARLFATLSSHPSAKPALKIFSTSFPQAPRSVQVGSGSQQATDLSWYPNEEALAVACDKNVVLIRAESSS